MPYAPHPEEGGYVWASRGVDPYQVYGFMPDNLPANAATIRNIFAEGKPIEDKPVLEPGHRVAGLQAQLWSETIRTDGRSEEHTSELQSLMRISYDVFCLKKKRVKQIHYTNNQLL